MTDLCVVATHFTGITTITVIIVILLLIIPSPHYRLVIKTGASCGINILSIFSVTAVSKDAL